MQRGTRRFRKLRPTRIAIAVGAAFMQWMWVQPAWAAGPSEPTANLPTGGKWANNPDGTAGGTISTPSAAQMQLNQNQRSGVIDFNCFCSRQGTLVNLTAPTTDSTTLIRSQEGVNFWGRFTANDNVFLTSSAGVYFSRTASVDVNSLVATSLGISNADFFAGRYNFSKDGSAGSVVNEGVITVNGYAALAGPQVQNNGLILAQAGTVALAAGDRVTLDMVGDGLIKVSVDAAALNALALNSGTIQADGGRVILTARGANALLDTVINNTGVIRARSLVERNGEIVLEGGSAGVVANSGTLDASGTDAGTTGGTVTVHGQHVHLVDGSSVDASGVAGGGTVTVKGDDTAYIYGNIDARGAGEGSNGGFVETSGHYLEVSQAPETGAGGTWLIDPYNIDVVTGAGTSNNGGSPSFTPNGNNSQIGADLINGQLNGGANVVLDTGGSGSPGTQAGDVRVLAAIDKTVQNQASLTLKAFHDVTINQPISIASGVGAPGPGTLTVEAGNDVIVNAPITTPGGALRITAGGFTNHSAINNGVGPELRSGMSITADRFNLAGGTINGGLGSVGLFTKTATNSLGVESAGDTTITNADIASITTSPDSPLTNANQLLIGVGSAGTMRIGDNAQVNGASKNLVFSSGFGSGTRITVGANGLTTTGDVMLDGTGGSIAGTGTVGGNHVVLRASTGIGASTARVTTAADTLAVNTGGNAFVSEANNVTLDNVTLMGGNTANTVGGTLDFAANGSVTVGGIVFAGAGMNVSVAQDLNVTGTPGRSAILTTNGQQTVTAANISLQGAASGTNGRAIIANTGGTADQTINVSGTLRVAGGDSGLTNAAAILTNGNQAINGNAEITLTGGASGTGSVAAQTHNSASIQSNGAGKTQTINASKITLKAGGGNDAFAGISAANQFITVAGDVDIKGGSGTGVPIARIGGIGTPAGATNLNLSARDVIITGGDAVTGEAGLGGTVLGTGPQPNTINIIASRDVTLNGGTGGARIGTSASFAAPASGDISVTAGRNIELNGTSQPTAIRTAGSVTLNAASISEGSNGFVQATSLSTITTGATNLSGPNDVARFDGATSNPGASLTLVDAGALQLTGVATNNGAITLTTDSLGNAGAVTNGGAANTANVVLNANAFDLAGGTIDGGAAAVILRPRTGSNSFGIEAAGTTTLTNADIATINTSNFIVFGSGIGTLFTGNMTIGENAVVNGGGRNLAFFRSSTPGGTTTVGNRGVATTGDLIVSAGGGAIVSNGGTVAGDEVQLRASQGIGTPGARVQTAANALAVNNGGGLGAFVREADDVVLRTVSLNVGGTSNVTSNFSGTGFELASGGDVTVSDTVQSNGAMNVNVAGSLDVVASPGRAAMLSTNGSQTISATNISLQAALSGDNGKAFITNNGGTGDQVITVSGGSLTVTGGAGGLANQAGILSNGNQTINGNPQITITGGASGTGSVATQTHNNATILTNGSGKTQIINAAAITAKAGAGNDAFAGITGANQTIVVSGDVQLTGGAGTGAPIARIGGVSGAAPGATNLFLSARDVILTGGDSATGDALLGSTPIGTSPQPNTINVVATRDVILDAHNGGARIGTSQNFATPASGDISINAGRNIELKGGPSTAAIRTAGSVTLNAASISEGSNGFVQATSLGTTTHGATSLTGSNAVASFNGTTFGGDLALNNSGALNVTGISAGNTTLANDGAVTLSGPVNTAGSFNATVDGDLAVSGTVNAVGMDLAVTGTLSVVGTAGRPAQLAAFGGQTITAQSIEVTAEAGGLATITNNIGGNQVINVTGGAADTGFTVQAVGAGGAAFVTNFAPTEQRILVTNADYIKVDGHAGNANISSPVGEQVVSITGSRQNAIRIGSDAAIGGSIINGSAQTITAGNAGESGSITLIGSDANGFGASFVNSGPTANNAQTIRTSGDLTIRGGAASAQTAGAGIFQNRPGRQSISAANISLQAGSGGSGNGAFINAGFGGDQEFDVAGTISLNGGSGGVGNRAGFAGSANQTINGNPDIALTGGSGGGASLSGNGAFINTSGGTGKQQTINAASINLRSGSGGVDNSASMTARKQVITVDGDVNLIGGASQGTLGGVRLGGLSGASFSDTDLTLTLNNGGNLALTGGSVPTNIAAIGSTTSGPSPLANTINISAAGNVVLNPGAANARIGNSATAADAGGDISISAGGIQLNGSGATPTVIRTTGRVSLNAGAGGIREGSNGFVAASELTTSSAGNTSLTGPNQVARFTAQSESGDVSLRNTASVLTLGTMDLPGSLAVDQTGALAVPGTVSALNQSMQATGDVAIGGASGGLAGLFAPGTISISTPQSVVLRGSDTTFGGASVVAAGGLVTLNAGEVHLLGGAAPLAAASVLGGDIATAVARDYTLTSGSGWGCNALLFSAGNITMTIGGILTIDGGQTPGNWARIQTASREATITLNFPNLDSGGFFVDGFEGKIKHGQDGFFTGVSKPAKLGDTLQLIYGL